MLSVRALEVRILGRGDIQAMRDMLAMFGRAFAEPETYEGSQPGDDYLGELLGARSFIAIAAMDGADVVGGLAAYVLPKFEQERSEIYIYDADADAQARSAEVVGINADPFLLS